MVNLRHETIEVCGGVPRICKESDVTALPTPTPPSTASDTATLEATDESFSSACAIPTSCVSNVHRIFASIHKDLRTSLKHVTWTRKTSNKKASSTKLARLTMSWKANAFATVRSVHVRLASAHNHQACAAALLYAHAHIVNLIEQATKKLQDNDETLLNLLAIIKRLCAPCGSSAADPNRCSAAALACEDFMRYEAVTHSQNQDTE